MKRNTMRARIKRNKLIWVIGGSSIFLLVLLMPNSTTEYKRHLMADIVEGEKKKPDYIPPMVAEYLSTLKNKDQLTFEKQQTQIDVDVIPPKDASVGVESKEIRAPSNKFEGMNSEMLREVPVQDAVVVPVQDAVVVPVQDTVLAAATSDEFEPKTDVFEKEDNFGEQDEIQTYGSTEEEQLGVTKKMAGPSLHLSGSNNVIHFQPNFIDWNQEGFNNQQQGFQANGRVDDIILRDDDPKVQAILERIENLINELGDDAYGVSGLPMDSNTFARKKELESLKNSLPSKHRREIWLRDHPFAKDDCPLADMDLFLPLHHNDGPLSAALFNSIERVFTCFHELIIVIPPESEYMIPGSIPSYAKVFIVPEPISRADMGYIGQQVIKIYIDKFSKAKRVLILEADLIMKAWVDSCFLGVDGEGNYNGKVRTYCATFEQGGADMWAKGIQHAIGGDMSNMDCTVLSPFVYHVEIFSQFREFIQKKHKKPFGKFIEDYYEGHSADWSKDNLMFSEFNILNHFMLKHRPDLVELVTPDNPKAWESWTPKPFWSAEESWGSRVHCSYHLSDPSIIPRNYDLPNPKLSSEYFDVAYKSLDTSEGMQIDGRERVTLETMTV